MNLQNFLESGLLESYILGQCSPDEVGIVEQMLADHEMARNEKAAIEAALEQYAQARALAPPGWMRGRILDQVNALPSAPPIATGPTGINWRTILSGVFLVAAGLAAVLYYDANGRVQQLESEKTQIKLQADNCEQERAAAQQESAAQMAFLADTTTRGITLKWVNPNISAPGAWGMAFNNPGKATTYIRLTNLPALAANQDYQFWVFTKGIASPQPLDVIRYQDSVLIKTQYRDEAQTFAMSIEPKGGSPTGVPTTVVMVGS